MAGNTATEGQSVNVQGRIVWCLGKTPFDGKIKQDQNTKQPVIDLKTNQPVREFGFGLAVPKSELQPGKSGHALWLAMQAEALKIYPSGQFPPGFAWKFKDGDTVDDKGVLYSQREGYAGCLVFSLTTRLNINFFKWENGAHQKIAEGIKCGDYVEAQVHVKAHPASGTYKAGLYLNPNAVLFLAYGPEIVSTGADATQIFGAQAPQFNLPPGASTTPIVPQGASLPQMPGMVAQQQMQAPPQNYGVLPPQHQPQQTQQMAMPVPNGAMPANPMTTPAAPGLPSIPGWPQQ